MGRKESQFSDQVDNYIARINKSDELPMAYRNMVGHFESPSKTHHSPSEDQGSDFRKYERIRDYYLTKESNPEQKKIINLLEKNDCVSVQGPPGTAKSHTIANLIGHLLAKGKSVLVSSYRSKTLEVINDHMAESIKPLCVSILDNQKNKDQMQKSVNYLERLTIHYKASSLTEEIKKLKSERKKIIAKVSDLESDFDKCILNEHRAISFQGESISPKEGAEYISKNREKLIFNSPLLSDVLPLTTEMHDELKFILRNVGKEDQQTIEHTIPEIKKILKPEELDFFINEKSKFEEEISTVKGREYLIFEKLDKVFLEEINSKVDFVMSFFKNNSEKYLRAMMGLMLKSDDYVSIFKENIESLEKSIEYIRKRSYSVRKYDPKLESNHDWDKLIRCAENICNTKASEVDKEKCVKFSYIKGIFNKEVGIIKNKARVHGRKICNVGELCSIVDLLEIKKERRSLEENWDQHISSRLGVQRTSGFKKAVEDEISNKLHGMKNIFQVKQCYNELNQILVEKNVVIRDFVNENIESKTDDPCQELKATFDGLNILVSEPLMVALEKKRIEELSINLQESINYLKKFSCDSTFNKEIFSSLNNRNYPTYKNNYSRLVKLSKQSKLVEKLKDFSSDISNTAPSFADDLLSRKIDQKIFDLVDIQNSWKASYLDNELTERNSVDPMEIQDSLVNIKNKLKSLDSVLIQNLSMQNQLSRITSEQRQALRGFVLAQNKITKSGKGVRDLTLRKGAKNQMKKCKGAVPVWIMPLSKVMDNFVIGEDTFDVLIIDEASQADITYLPIFSLAKKVVVVGDDKQVSPQAAGIKLDGIDELINEFSRWNPKQGGI